MTVDEVEALHARENVIRTVDCHRDDRQIQLGGQLEGSLAEHPHMAGERAGTFGKDDERRAAAEGIAGAVVGFLNLLRPRLVDENMAGLFASVAHEGNAAEGLFHHPLEVAPEEAIDQEDVHLALMVGHEDIRGVVVDVFAAYDMHRYQ